MNLTLERFGRRSSAALKRGAERLKKSVLSLKWYEWLMIGIMTAVAIYSVVCNHIKFNPAVLGITNLKALINGTELTTVEQAMANYYQEPIWLNYLYCIGAVVGIMCIFFCAKASISNFIFGLVNTIILILYFGYWGLHDSPYWGTFFLELLVYLPTGIISWIIWARHRDQGKDELTKARKFTWWQNILLAAGVISLVVGVYFVLSMIVDPILLKAGFGTITGIDSKSSWYRIGSAYGVGNLLGWLDAAVFAIGISATFLQMFRFREQYILWLVQDVVVVTQFTLPLFIDTPKGFDPVYWTKKMIYLIMAIIGLINWIKLQKARNITNE